MATPDLRSALVDIVSQRRQTYLGTGTPFATAPLQPGSIMAQPKTAQGSRAAPTTAALLPMRYDERSPTAEFQYSVMSQVLVTGYVRDLSVNNAKFTSQVGGGTPNPASAKKPSVDPGADPSVVPQGPPNLNSTTF